MMITTCSPSMTMNELVVFVRFDSGFPNIEFYADATNASRFFAEFSIPEGGLTAPGTRFVDINDPVFQSYLRVFVLPQMGRNTAVKELLVELMDYFRLYSNPDKVSPRVRTAGSLRSGQIEYNLANDSNEFVRVTPEGWRVTTKHKHKFLSSAIALPQIMPAVGSRSLPQLMKPYVNIASEDDLLLLCTWLVQAFCDGNHLALLLMAGRGSGKSCLSKMLRQIIDPSRLGVCTMPDKLDALFATLSNSYMVAFDNTAELSKNVSDILCSAITGTVCPKRELYTTNSISIFELHNTVILNGIDILPSQSDLADRCLLLKLQSISEQTRKPESELWEAFDNDHAEILGAIFTTLSTAMSVVQTLNPQKKPRMADAYIDMLAIAIAMGYSEEKFSDIFFGNQTALDKARAEIAIVEAIAEFMASPYVTGRKVSGTMTEIYRKVKETYSGSKADLPKSASHFSRKLTAEHAALYAAGFMVNIDPKSDATHLEIIKK